MATRRARIICTIGPATSSYPVLEQMYHAGMNVVRLNMSHSDHASALKIINWIKTLNRKAEQITDHDERVALFLQIANLYIERFSNQAEAIKAYEESREPEFKGR